MANKPLDEIYTDNPVVASDMDGTELAYLVKDSADAAANLANIATYVESGLGSAAFAATGDFATAAQGTTADSAVQPTDSVTTLNMNTARLLGRSTASAGAVEEITVGSGLSLSAGSLTATGSGGTVTNTGGNLTSNAVVLGAGSNDAKVVAGITTNGTAQLVLGVNATTLGSVKLFGNTSGDATISPAAVAGTATAITLPAVSGTLLVSQLAENEPILLDAAGSADGKYSGIAIAGTAGATLAFGDLCYLAVADSRWELADADSATTAGGVLLGICVLAAAADGDPTRMLLYGNVRADAAFPTLTIGAPAYVGTSAGDIQVAQPNGEDDVIRIVGHALTADELLFNPSQDWMTYTV